MSQINQLKSGQKISDIYTYIKRWPTCDKRILNRFVFSKIFDFFGAILMISVKRIGDVISRIGNSWPAEKSKSQ